MNFLSVYRKAKRLTQYDVGKMLNVTDTLVSKWETSKVIPSNEQIVKLSEIYKVEVKKLFPELFGE